MKLTEQLKNGNIHGQQVEHYSSKKMKDENVKFSNVCATFITLHSRSFHVLGRISTSTRQAVQYKYRLYEAKREMNYPILAKFMCHDHKIIKTAFVLLFHLTNQVFALY